MWWVSSSVVCSANNGKVTDPDGLVDTTGSGEGSVSLVEASVSLVEAGRTVGRAGGEVTDKILKEGNFLC